MMEKHFSETRSQTEHSDSNRFDPDKRVEMRQSDFQSKAESFDPDKRVHYEPNESIENRLAEIEKQDAQIEKVESNKSLLDISDQNKGNYGEMKTDQDMRNRGYERISHDMVTDLADKTHQGIDGVYYNKDGEPQYMIVDAKYGSSQLSETAEGRQMSQPWIDARLEKAVGADMADKIFDAQLEGKVGAYVARVDIDGNVTYHKLDENGYRIQEGARAS